jgi:tetratricopeptide (TPR) repeat protein
MSRFDNLEFDDQAHADVEQQPSLKDESFHLTEANAAFAAGDFERALRYFARALEYNALNPASYAGQVRSLIELGEFAEAEKWAAKALEQFPRDAELLSAAAVALARQGQLDSAMAYSDAAVEARGNSPYLWLSRADVLLARGEAAAEFCFEKALALARGDWFWHWLAARIRMFYRQFTAAWRILQVAAEAHAEQFILWLELGRCQLALGMSARAAVSFNRARELNPSCTAARLGRMEATHAGIGARVRGAWRSLFGR